MRKHEDILGVIIGLAKTGDVADSGKNLWTIVNDVRTFFEQNPDFVIPPLPETRIT